VPNKIRLRSAILPTWSWASVDGRIRHELTPDMALARQTANDTRLEDIMFFVTPTSWKIDVIKKQSSIIQNAALIIDKCFLVKLPAGDAFLLNVEVDRHSDTLFIMPIVGAYDHRYKRKKYTRVGGIPMPYLAGELDRTLHGIVLREVAGKPGTFERVGYFSVPEPPVLERACKRTTEEGYFWRYSVRIE
jgi:hypothetical protein